MSKRPFEATINCPTAVLWSVLRCFRYFNVIVNTTGILPINSESDYVELYIYMRSFLPCKNSTSTPENTVHIYRPISSAQCILQNLCLVHLQPVVGYSAKLYMNLFFMTENLNSPQREYNTSLNTLTPATLTVTTDPSDLKQFSHKTYR